MPDPIDDLKAVKAAFERAEEEDAFWDAHYADLVGRYPGEFVAVKRGEVVDHDPDLMLLDQRLRPDGHGHGDAWVRFMATDHHRFLL